MSGISGHIVRRGLAVARNTFQDGAENGAENGDKLTKGTAVVLALTILGFSLWTFTIKYSYLKVVGALAIVESPQTDVLVQVDLVAAGDQSKKLLEQEVMVVRPQPITSKIRTTIQHLRAKAGYWSRFRGMSLFITYSIVRNIFVHILMGVVGRGLWKRLAAHFVTEILLCRFEMTWIHIVISEPSPLRWYKRVPRGWKPFKNIAPAAALKSAANVLVVALPAIYACHSKLGYFQRHQQAQLTESDVRAIVIDLLIVVGIYINMALLIEIPATVTFVRVAASMLPEDTEAIVPFDRTFNGKVTPEIVGGAGKVGLMEAWRSFDRSSRIRLLKLIAKVIAIQASIVLLFFGVIIGELKVMMGEDFDKMVEQGKRIVKH